MSDVVTQDEENAVAAPPARAETDVVSAAAGGAAVGAVMGSFVEPGIGSIVGTVLGIAVGGGIAAFQRYVHF